MAPASKAPRFHQWSASEGHLVPATGSSGTGTLHAARALAARASVFSLAATDMEHICMLFVQRSFFTSAATMDVSPSSNAVDASLVVAAAV
eukprot:6177079-Pleurochrysis_carterae.AAC.1